MVLGENLPVYADNKLGGYMLEWRISQDVAKNVEYYDNVIALNKQFEEHPPEVIIDEQGLFPGIVKRIPGLASQYRKDNNVYWRNAPISPDQKANVSVP
jgi:hypothetical protein